jgi:hypothetical protein
MAYLARIETQLGMPIEIRALEPTAPEPDFSPLEWSIIRLSRVDALWTIRPMGPVRRLWNRLMSRGNPALANARLEALRRMAVLSRHFGFSVPGDDVADFLSAGFTPGQYELMVRSITATSAIPNRIAA